MIITAVLCDRVSDCQARRAVSLSDAERYQGRLSDAAPLINERAHFRTIIRGQPLSRNGGYCLGVRKCMSPVRVRVRPISMRFDALWICDNRIASYRSVHMSVRTMLATCSILASDRNDKSWRCQSDFIESFIGSKHHKIAIIRKKMR